MPTVADVMDATPTTVEPDAKVERVVELLREFDLPGLPVVNDGGRCVGIITEADLVIGDEQGDFHIPHYIELFGGLIFLPDLHHLSPFKGMEDRIKKASAARAEDLMTADPVTIESTATVKEAARIIATEGHNRLPVVDHGRFMGLVTRVDVLQALSQDDG